MLVHLRAAAFPLSFSFLSYSGEWQVASGKWRRRRFGSIVSVRGTNVAQLANMRPLLGQQGPAARSSPVPLLPAPGMQLVRGAWFACSVASGKWQPKMFANLFAMFKQIC